MDRRSFLKQTGIVTGSLMAAGNADINPTAWAEINPYQLIHPRSKAPQFIFSDTLDEQLAELKNNPLMKRFRESRRRFSSDPYRPIYHFVSPESTMNDPNGLCFWQGRWHLFYQGYPPEDRCRTRPGRSRQHWGHTVSDDLIHWRDLPYAIYPHPEDACYSGSTLVEKERVIANYFGRGVQGNMVAVSSDPLLLNWEKLTGGPVIKGPSHRGDMRAPYRVFDPCIWKKGDMYYSLSGSRSTHEPTGRWLRAHYLFRSPDLKNWEYLHEFVEGDRYSLVGDDGACPYFWPIGDRHILLYFSHMSGGKYLLGDYDTKRDKFVVASGGDFNFGTAHPAGVHAPSAAPDGKGGVIAIFNMNPGFHTREWDQIMTLPRRLRVIDRNELNVTPAGDIESLRLGHERVGKMNLPANEEIILNNVRGNAMEIKAEIIVKKSPMIEMKVLRSPDKQEFTRITFFWARGMHDRWHRNDRYSLITIDSSYSSMLSDVRSRPPETAPVYVGLDESLKLRVFIDKSVVEVFVNGRQCVSLRVYPGREDSLGVSLLSQGRGAVLKSFDAWQMDNIYKNDHYCLEPTT